MEQYSRIEKIINKDAFLSIKRLSILIVGIGGVGGCALEMLARSGIEKINIIDFDRFEESNLNRQILSLKNNIGEEKVKVAKKRISMINTLCNVKIYNEKINEGFNGIEDEIDYIIDACDDVKAKVALVKYALKNNIKIISSCGTGNRLHPEKLIVTNIWKTNNDPLAKKFRHELKKEGIYYKLPVISSEEKPITKTRGYVGSISTVPNAAGILLASYVLNDVIKNYL